MIGVDHPLTPPYPKGDEIPPADCTFIPPPSGTSSSWALTCRASLSDTNMWTGKREWPNYSQSRPFVCHVYKYNMRILNVSVSPVTPLLQGAAFASPSRDPLALGADTQLTTPPDTRSSTMASATVPR
jgi:hypothetical protein